MPRFTHLAACALLASLAGCAACPARPPDEHDAGSRRDAGLVPDAGPARDAGLVDDGGPQDGGFGASDAGFAHECGAADPCRRNFDCGGGFVCHKADPNDEMGCCLRAICELDAHCAEGERCSFFGQCQPLPACDPLGGESGCEESERCLTQGGLPTCVAASEAPGAVSCEVWPGRLVLASGERLAATAVGQTSDFALAPRAAATWSTTLGAIEEGRFVRASCEAGAPCAGTLSAALPGGASCGAALLVLPALADDQVRLTLVDPTTGAAVAGAPVTLRLEGESEWYEDVTGDEGIVTFSGIAPGGQIAAITAFAVEREWVTLVAPASRDLLATSAPQRSPLAAAGLVGSFTYPTYPGAPTGDIRVGFAGLSQGGGWLEGLLPSPWPTEVTMQVVLEGVTDPGGQAMDLPLGAEAWIGADAIKPQWVALGDPGPRMVWGLATRVRLSDMGELISAATGEQMDEVAIALWLARRSGGAAHGLAGPYELSLNALPAPHPTDPPAWPFDEAQLTADTRPLLELQAQVGELPCLPGAGEAGACSAHADGVTVRVGALVPGLGFVPLALSAAADDPDAMDGLDQLDGFLDHAEGALPKGRVLLGAAPPHRGLEGWPARYLVTTSLKDDEGAHLGRSAVVAPPSGLDEVSALPSLPPFPAGTFTPATGFSAPSSGASLVRLRLSSSAGVWSVWSAGDGLSLELADLRPPAVTGRDEEAHWQIVRLAAAAASEDLFSLDGARLDHLEALIEAAGSASCVEATATAAPACQRVP